MKIIFTDGDTKWYRVSSNEQLDAFLDTFSGYGEYWVGGLLFAYLDTAWIKV